MLSPDIRYFMETARVGGMGRAAELLGLSQPALSKAIARLERQAGTPLLRRLPRGVELTDAGRALYERACLAAVNLEDGVQMARDIGQGHAGLLRLGMTPATSHFTLGALFPRLRQERPASVLKLLTAFGDELFEALLQQKLNLAVGPVPRQIPDGLHCEALYEEGFSLVHNRSHPLARREHVSPQDLEDCEAAAPGIHEVARQTAEQAMRELGLRPPRVVVEANSLAAVLCAVSTCPLITIIPNSTPAHTLPDNLVVRPIPLPDLRRQVGVFTGPAPLSSIGERALTLLKMHAAAQRPVPRNQAFP